MYLDRTGQLWMVIRDEVIVCVVLITKTEIEEDFHFPIFTHSMITLYDKFFYPDVANSTIELKEVSNIPMEEWIRYKRVF
jgi:hypothetical protein